MRHRLVRHRWRLPVGQEPEWYVGDVVVGKQRQWVIVAIEPIDSPVHPNDYRVSLRPLADLDAAIDHCHHVSGARVRAYVGAWERWVSHLDARTRDGLRWPPRRSTPSR